MRMITLISAPAVVVLSAIGLVAQQAEITPSATVPRLVRIANSFRPADGSVAAPVESVTFAIYKEEHEGTPLWRETQNVTVDADGRYSALLGFTLPDGLPADLFATGEPRWLGARFNRPGEIEQARVRLASVPYALKASDADTLGGRPASAYLLDPNAAAAVARGGAAGGTAAAVASKLPKPHTITGTMNFLPFFTDNSNDLGNSALYESGGNIGLGTTSPLTPLHIVTNGTGNQFLMRMQNTNSGGGANFQVYNDSGNRAQVGIYGSAQPAAGAIGTGEAYLYTSAPNLDFAAGAAGSSIKFMTAGVTERARIDPNGNVGIGTNTGLSRLTVKGQTSFTATGTAATDGSGTITGVGTKFLSEIGLGDRIQIPAGTGPIYAVSAVFTDTSIATAGGYAAGTGQSILVLPSLFRVDTSAGYTGFRVTDQGNVQLGGNYSIAGANPRIFLAAPNAFAGTSTTFIPGGFNGETFAAIVMRDSSPATMDSGTILGFSGQPGGINGIYAGIRGAKENSTSTDFGGYLGLYTTQNGSPNTFAERLRISSTGNVGIGTTTPTANLHVAAGDVYVSNPGSGIILKSPDASHCARISLDNTGTLITTSIACP